MLSMPTPNKVLSILKTNVFNSNFVIIDLRWFIIVYVVLLQFRRMLAPGTVPRQTKSMTSMPVSRPHTGTFLF